AHPELGYREHHAVEQLTGLLSEGGLPWETGIASTPTACRAVVQGQAGRPSVAILAEYDALPEIGHGCGHNLIATAAMGAALALKAVAQDLPGSAVLLGCPAEESTVDDPGGKIRLVGGGYFDAVDAALMVHPATEDLVSRRGSLAACGYEFAFTGKPAHAASMPHQGINALDGVIQTFNGVNALRQHLQPDVRIHGIITYGGASANIVPAKAVCRFRVRAEEGAYLASVVEKVKRCAQAGALASGATLTIREVARMYEDMWPSAALGKVFRDNLIALGRPMRGVPRHKGKGSTDFGNVSHVVPSVSASLRIAGEGVAGHSQVFADAAISEAGRRMMLDAAKGLALTAIDLMSDPALLAAARAELTRRQGAAAGS
ncbi:MAG: M20 family metallopeptidase, partial [Chloroflexota bacterium]|nr:M20 family metallopeptidase [Chloroflexota bacterium]